MEAVGNRHLRQSMVLSVSDLARMSGWGMYGPGCVGGRAHDGGLVCLHAAVTVGPPPAPPHWRPRTSLHFMAVAPRQPP